MSLQTAFALASPLPVRGGASPSISLGVHPSAALSTPRVPHRRARPRTLFPAPSPTPSAPTPSTPTPDNSGAPSSLDPPLNPLLLKLNHATVALCVSFVNALYPTSDYAFRRFYVLEVMARVPFFAWTCLLHLRETLSGPSDLGTERLRAHFEQSDNEALHLAVMSEMGGGSEWLDQFLSAHFGMLYFFVSVAVFVVSPAVAFHFGDCVERHAYETYDEYLRENAEALQTQLEVPLIAHEYYESEQPPRSVRSMFDVITHIRDDEMHHSAHLNDYAVEACKEA